MHDENLYLVATNEVDSDQRDLALWAKAVALAEGDEEKARYKYIKLRVEQLSQTAAEYVSPDVGQQGPGVPENHISVRQFSRTTSIPEKEVIEKIREGEFSGRISNGEWFIDASEINDNQIQAAKRSSLIGKDNVAIKEYIPLEEFIRIEGISEEKAVQMIRDGFYRGKIVGEDWVVHVSEIRGEGSDISSSDVSLRGGGFFSLLAQGEFGLVKTYWLYGVLVGILFRLATYPIQSVKVIVVLYLGYIAYQIPLFLGIWRAAENYRGWYVWAALAKLAVVLGWVVLGIGFLTVLLPVNT